MTNAAVVAMAAMIGGLVLVLVMHQNNTAALGGVGLIVVGALVIAITYDDTPQS